MSASVIISISGSSILRISGSVAICSVTTWWTIETAAALDFFRTAQCKGVLPLAVSGIGFAPADNSNLITLVALLFAAQCRGVINWVASMFMSAPYLSRTATAFAASFPAAQCSGVKPPSVLAFISAPLFINSKVISSSLSAAAICSGLMPAPIYLLTISFHHQVSLFLHDHPGVPNS